MAMSTIIRLSLFCGFSVVLGYLSRASLRVLTSHGFYRFFAWESILGLFLLNVDVWFRNPFSVRQLVSWVLLLLSGFLVLHAAWTLRRFGRPGEGRSNDARPGDARPGDGRARDGRRELPLAGIEKTTRVVEQGAYRFIRHPLYASLLLLAWGIFFKDVKGSSCVLVTAATGFLVVTAKVDEAESTRRFGAVYREYMKRTKMFIPFLL